MHKKLFFRVTGLFLLLLLPSLSFSQEYPIVQVDPWTTKARKKSTYFPMVEWDSSPYKEFTYWKRSGPEVWQVEEYINFRMLPPINYDPAKDEKKYPLIILLHGAGESGVAWSNHFDYVNGYKDTPPEPEKIDNNDHQLLFGGQEYLAARNQNPDNSRAFPGFVLFPQVPYNGAWAGEFKGPISTYNRQLVELIEILIVKYHIDPNRIYLSGLSNGARGVWDLIYRRPDLFAAAISISGLGDVDLMSERVAHLPIWQFQGGKDTNPAPSGTYQLINSIEGYGGNPRLTFYENLGHGVWNNAFREPDFFSWLLSKSKLSVHVYFGQTHFQTIDDINVQLGISPGFNNYEWKVDGETIGESNSNNLTVKKPGAYQVRFQREEHWTNWSDPVFITSDETPPPSGTPIQYRVNVGGNAITDEASNWSADNSSNPSPFLMENVNSSVYETEFSSSNYTGIPDKVFSSGRQTEASIHYKFPINGSAEVVLFFAAPSIDATDHRIIDIEIEGESIENSWRLVKSEGTDAIKKTFHTNVLDGNLDVILNKVEGNPVLSGIEVKGSNLITAIPDETPEQQSLLIFPNPFNDQLNLMINKEGINIETIIIRNLSGKSIFEEKIASQTNAYRFNTELSQIASGLYLFEIHFNDGSKQTFKIIKQ